MIVVRALGPTEVSVNGAAAPAKLLWKKTLALLMYPARSPKGVRTREHLTGLLWGDKREEKARHSLNEAVHVLRLCAGADGVQSDTAQVRIAPGTVELDTETLERLAAAGDYAGAAALINGAFLEGFSVRSASEFDDWLAAERQHWCRRSVDVLVRRAEQLLAAGNVAAAYDTVQRARELDWRPETAVRCALRTLALAGDRAGALALFKAFASRLKRDLGAEPDAETRALAERVRLERAWRLPKARRDAGARAADCSMLEGSPGLHLPRWRSSAARRRPVRLGAPSRKWCRRWRTSSRWSCSWMTRIASTRSRCSRSGGSCETWRARLWHSS